MVVLRYVLDYSPGEIAELLELPRGTVNSRLRRGLDTLQERVTRETVVSEDRVRSALRQAPLPDEAGAAERAWALVERGVRVARADPLGSESAAGRSSRSWLPGRSWSRR